MKLLNSASGFISIILLAAAAPAYAGVVITEIMYDLEGADTGREWIEIKADATTDLTGWKLFENGTNHGLTLIQGNAILQANTFAIIADNTEKFLIDWPSFSGTLFDSSFSLSNTGETLALRNAELSDIDSATYSSELGANGDGKSLQKTVSDWAAASPTPGSGDTGQESVAGGGTVMAETTSNLKAGAGGDRIVLAGAETLFSASAEGFGENIADGAEYFWNFGDGVVARGKNAAHAFQYPGSYTAFLEISFAGAYASDAAKITAIENPVIVSEIKPGQWLEIYNNSPRKVDFSNFGVQILGSDPFYFQANTFLAPYAYAVLGSDTLGFEIPKTGEVRLVYPNGKILLGYTYQGASLLQNESLSFESGSSAKTKPTPGAKNETIKKLAVAAAATKPADEPSKAAPQTASVINIEPQKGAGVFGRSDYFWLLAGLGAGALAAVIFVVGKRYLA